MFDIVYVMTNGGPGNSSLILSLYGYQNAFAYHQRGYGAAIGVISLLVLLLPVTLYIKEVSKSHEA
jgi:ABC-type sugar transport system permease subunit